MQETGLDVRGDIKVRDTALARKELTQMDKTFIQETEAQSRCGWGNEVQHENTDPGVNGGPALSSCVTLGKVT